MTETTQVEKTDDVQITELAAIEPTRVDGVGAPASGFPILMMKSLAPAAAPVAKDDAGCGCCDSCQCGTAKTAAESKPKKAKKTKAPKQQAGTDATKSATMPEDGGSNASSTKAADITPDVIAKAVAEATAPLQAQLQTVQEQMAKVLATPIPGGPQLVMPPNPRTAEPAGLSKAARFRAIAAQTSDPEARMSYLELAAREEAGGAPITKE